MHKIILAVLTASLALFAISAGGRSNEVHQTSRPLSQGHTDTLVVPGSQAPLASVDIDITFLNQHTFGAENTSAGPALTTFVASPVLEMSWFAEISLQPQGLEANLAPYDGETDYGGSSGTLVANAVEQTVISLHITNPDVLAMFEGKQAEIPLLFLGNCATSMTASGQTLRSSLYGWDGEIRYTYVK